MTTGTQTTTIILSRGSEDVELLAELHRVTAAVGFVNIQGFIENYPRLHELKQALEGEKEAEYDY